jgi:hypothetical protein
MTGGFALVQQGVFAGAHFDSKGRHIRVRGPLCTSPLYSIRKRIYPLLIERFQKYMLRFFGDVTVE